MKTPKFRTNYSNLKLQGSEQRVSRGTGRREWWLSFYCACGEMFSAASVRGSLKARIVPEWERIVMEATELANLEASGATLPGDWTREMIADGLSITSFSQYRAPIDSSVS